MKEQTAVEWLMRQISSSKYFYKLMEDINSRSTIAQSDIIEHAKQMEKEQMIKFAEFVATYQDKNRNYLNQTLHAKSKYDEAERTIDLLERYYNETYKKELEEMK